MKNKQWEKFEQEVHNNIESMIGEFELDAIHKVGTTKCYVQDTPDSEKEFYGITVYPFGLYDDVLPHIENILDEDADTISLICDLFTYTIIPNALMTRTNQQVMDEIKTMLQAYNASLVKYIDGNRNEFDNESLVYDYDAEQYIYSIRDKEMARSNDEFMSIDNIRYEHTSKGGKVKCRWYEVA